MTSSIKSLIKFLTFSTTDFFLKRKSEIVQKSILLIRLDAIGDYILFRNYIDILKKSEKYQNYSITLLGNIAWKSISEELDKKYIDNFIWMDRKQFERNPFYRYKKLKEITQQGYELVINPTYSRTFFVDDYIVKIVNAKEKIGSIGDLSNIRKWQKKISDKYYTKLLSAQNGIMFEFDRNREFFENLLENNISIKKPYIKLQPKKLEYKLPKNYAILFIGASAKFRKWSIKNFAEVGKFLKKKYGYEIVLCGGPTDIEEAKEFAKYFDREYLDLVGKTSLVELLTIIYNGNLMIANETSAPHFAVSLEMTNVFVISNGNHYGRFTPYPKEITKNYYPIYHPEIEKDLNNYKKLSNSYGFGSKLDIDEVSIKMVQKKIERNI